VIPPEEPILFNPPVFPDIGSETGSSVAVEDPFFELRRTFEDGSVETLFRFPDEVNTPEQLEEYIRDYEPKNDKSPLTDGSGYEVWSISKQVKRKVVEFEITAGQLRTAVEQLPETFENLELDSIPMPDPDADAGADETGGPADDSTSSLLPNSIDAFDLDSTDVVLPDVGFGPGIEQFDTSPVQSSEASAIIDTTTESIPDSDADSSASIALAAGLGFGHLARRLRKQQKRTNRFSYAERMRNRIYN